jgi:hypothetical protein
VGRWTGGRVSGMIDGMRRTLCCSLVALLFGFKAEAQSLNRNLIQPGDVLILKVLANERNRPLRLVVSEAVVVKSTGKLTPPSLPNNGIAALPIEDVSAKGLSVSQVAYQLRMSYAAGTGYVYRIFIERVKF